MRTRRALSRAVAGQVQLADPPDPLDISPFFILLAFLDCLSFANNRHGFEMIVLPGP
jgi:hypothetical protein